MKRYLSVDIDFWNGRSTSTAENDIMHLVSLARKKHIPVVAVMNHQQLLPYVNQSGATELVNLDTHSDLCALEDTDEFNCGTWVSYVRWRQTGVYRWLHMGRVSDGECSWLRPIFFAGGKTQTNLTDWKRVTRRMIKCMPNRSDLLKECVGIGIVLSPFYSDPELEDVFRKVIKTFDIPYKRGVRGEDWFHAKRKPPFRRTK